VIALLTLTAAKTAQYTAYGVTRVVPRGELLWRKVARLGLWRYQQASGANAVGIETIENQARLRPLVKAQADLEEGRAAGWRVKGDDGQPYLDPEGGRTKRLGGADILWLDPDHPVPPASWQSRYSVALMLDQKWRVFKNATVEVKQVFDLPEGGGGDWEAVADGGHVDPAALDQEDVAAREEISIRDPGSFDRALVDLSAPEGYAGYILDPERAATVQVEEVSTDDLQLAETRGLLAGMLEDDASGLLFKLFVAAALFVLGGWLAPSVMSSVAGSGGGSGLSAVSPFMIDLATAAVGG
jgi:hypothetical protein